MPPIDTIVQIADIAWKVVLSIGGIIAGVAFGPKLFRALQTWHEVKTAQLEAEKEIERARREAAEEHARLRGETVDTVVQVAGLLRGQLHDLRSQLKVQQETGDEPGVLREELSLVLLQTILLEVSMQFTDEGLDSGFALWKRISRAIDNTTLQRVMKSMNTVVRATKDFRDDYLYAQLSAIGLLISTVGEDPGDIFDHTMSLVQTEDKGRLSNPTNWNLDVAKLRNTVVESPPPPPLQQPERSPE